MPRLIDANALCRVLNDHWLATSPSDRDTAEVAAERAAMCRGLDYAMRIVEQMPTVGGWISVKDRMPVETHSIFWRLIGSKQWNNAMWREQSDKVLVAVSFKDGTRFVTTGETHDGEWYTTVSRTLTPEVTHWMQMPEPPEEVTGDA